MGDSVDMAAMLRLGLSFGAIIAALMAFKWWTRRGGVAATKGAIKVLARTSVTRSAVVCIVEAESRRFFVGVTDNGVSLLGEMSSSADLLVDVTDAAVVVLEAAETLQSEPIQSEPTLTSIAPGGEVHWQDHTELPRTGNSHRPWNGIVRRAQSRTLRSPSQVPAHAQRS